MAQSGRYDPTWNTVDGGGYTFRTGGSHTVSSTVGQTAAGVPTSGDCALAGGLWRGVPSAAGYDFEW